MTDGALDLKDVISLEKVTATGGFYVTENGPSLTTAGLKIDENTSLTSTGLTTPQGAFSTSVTVGDPSTGIRIGDGKITGLDTDAIANEKDAVSVGYLNNYVNEGNSLAVLYDDTDKDSITFKNETTISNLKKVDLTEGNANYAATVGHVYDVDQKVGVGKSAWTYTNFLNADSVTNLTEAATALDHAIGDIKDFTPNNILNESYNDVASALDDLNVSIGNLTFGEGNVLSGPYTVTNAFKRLDDKIGNVNFDNTPFLGTGYTDTDLTLAIHQLGSTLNIATNAIGLEYRQGDDGMYTMAVNWDGFHYVPTGQGNTIVTGMRLLDTEIYNILGNNRSSFDWSGTGITAGSSILSGVQQLGTRVTALEDKVKGSNQGGTASTNNGLDSETAVSTESAPTETTATEAPTAAAMESAVAKAPAAANSMLSSAQPMTMALNAPAPANGDPAPVGDPTGGDMSNIHTDGDTTIVEKDFTVEGDSTFKGSATFEQGADMNGQKITNVGAGTEATDGVNYGQLQAVQNQVDANTQNIGILGSAVNKLGDRIERVGAGAAALAALHPLDFDPDNKLDFAAGFGNYRGASAVAVGAFYRPSENVMFSVGGAFGGGEDMVNAGVSFKVGAGSGSATTSRTAMAKSLKSMQEVVASQDAQLAQQREQIDKLTAMVELLMEQNGQAQPKDGDAQAAQPQQ